VRREHDLDGQLEQRAETLDYVLSGDGLDGPLGMHLEPVTRVDEGVADDDGTRALHVEDEVVRLEAFERADAVRQRVAAAEHLSAHRIGIGRVGRRDVDRQAELRRVATVPRTREDDRGRALAEPTRTSSGSKGKTPSPVSTA
jgi:hypothetical protein